MSALDELLSAWRANPDAGRTIALCSHLGVAGRLDLIQEVASAARSWHGSDAGVMLAVGRMFLDASVYDEAQSALVAAGKANGRDWRSFRYLGEVLLRRGDAVRAEKVLERALQLGGSEADTKLWQDRANVFSALQRRSGVDAVAQEVARTHPNSPSVPPPTYRAESASAGFAGARRVPSVPPASLSSRPPPAQGPSVVVRKNSGGALPPPPARRHGTMLGLGSDGPPLPPQRRGPPLPEISVPSSVGFAGSEPPTVRRPIPDSLMEHARRVSSRPQAPAAAAAVAIEPEPPLPSFDDASFEAPPPAFAAQPSPARPAAPFMRSRGDTDEANPSPEQVLEQLAMVGVFEPGGGAPPAWERAPRQRSRGMWIYIVAIVLLVGGGIGGYQYSVKIKAERLAAARALNEDVEQLLYRASLASLKQSDEKLSRAFELDSRSEEAMRLWLVNRVLHALLSPGEAVGVDSAAHRARKVGLPEKELAFVKVASFLVEGDLAGAAGILPKWDKEAAKDPYYQLAAGAALERAGDPRALERYEAARALDQKLIVADLLLARVALLELGPERAKPIVESYRRKAGDRVETKALSALAWAVGDRQGEPPAKFDAAERAQLPVPLRPIPDMVDAVAAVDAGERQRATDAVERALKATVGPALATELGFLATVADDERLARRAALRALQFAAVYPRARILAARVALLGGRIQEAQKAIEQLDPTSREVAVVRGVVAYETLDAGGLQAVADTLGEAVESHPELGALAGAPKVQAGLEYPKDEALQALAAPTVPWGRLIAMDAALDQGKLELAGEFMSRWPSGVDRPVFELRRARLARYRGEREAALAASERALSGAPTLPVLIERVYQLLEAEQYEAAGTLIDRYPALLGPLANWLRVLLDAARGREAIAKASVAQLEPPGEGSPLVVRVLAARALAASGDTRARDLVRELARRVPRHPDLARAIEAL